MAKFEEVVRESGVIYVLIGREEDRPSDAPNMVQTVDIELRYVLLKEDSGWYHRCGLWAVEYHHVTEWSCGDRAKVEQQLLPSRLQKVLQWRCCSMVGATPCSVVVVASSSAAGAGSGRGGLGNSASLTLPGSVVLAAASGVLRWWSSNVTN
ncbi:hypothetical protein LWI29_034439 [Acer saccharum]|uniref:Uncharacterized protein n=1 Tax=Acer saccharum TaxID=4024 RepID=A0AA39TMG4_ACESA|nr:hypothetical protein LWI29_034439 [Acer saccharum]